MQLFSVQSVNKSIHPKNLLLSAYHNCHYLSSSLIYENRIPQEDLNYVNYTFSFVKYCK